MQSFEPGFEDVGVIRHQLDPAFGDQVGDANRGPVDAGCAARDGGIGAPAEGRVARVGKGAVGRRAEAAPDVERRGCDLHVGPQAVHRQTLQRGRGQRCGDVDQDRPFHRAHHEEIRQILSLRRQERGPDDAGRAVKRANVIGHETLQEVRGIGTGQLPEGSVGCGFACHGRNMGAALAEGKGYSRSCRSCSCA